MLLAWCRSAYDSVKSRASCLREKTKVTELASVSTGSMLVSRDLYTVSKFERKEDDNMGEYGEGLDPIQGIDEPTVIFMINKPLPKGQSNPVRPFLDGIPTTTGGG